MQKYFQPPFSEWTIGAICTGFAVLCGWVRYLTGVEAGRHFSWKAFFLEGVSSGTFGAMAYGVLSAYGIPPGCEGAACGMAGWLGAVLAKIVLAVIMKRLGVTKEDIAP